MVRTLSIGHLKSTPSSLSVWHRIAGALALRRSRLHLSRLDARLLDDVALSEEDARTEAARRSWDAPSHWYNQTGRH